MRNLSFRFGVLLLMGGVFGYTDAVKSVSVMERDSVILNPDLTDIQRDDLILWMFEDSVIARMNKADAIFSTYDADGRFRDRLNLDKQTGSLTISDITTEHTGHYQLYISGTDEISKRFSVSVSDIVKSVSVMEGDSVTLHTDVTETQRDDVIQWFGDRGVLIADLNGAVDTIWENIDLNDQTGDLTIRNIRRDQSGVYEMKINTSSMILHSKLYIAVGDEVKTVSVKKGEFISLLTGVIDLLGYDLILWKFEHHLIAEINKGSNRFLLHDISYEIFKGRLQLHSTGSLTISDSETTDSGVYYLTMSNSTYTLQRMISVSVSDSGSSGSVSGISGVSVVLMVWAVTVFLLQEV